MSLLILGPKSPGREIDVYLQPLIEELKELWTLGGGVRRGIRHVLYAWVIDRPSGYEVEYLSWDIDAIFHRITCDVEVGYTMESWMYPIERSLRTLKQYVRNKARPEGSIAEAYVMNESSTFCSRYLRGIETRFTRDERNDDTIVENEVIGDFEIFKQKVLELRQSANLSDDFFSLAMGPSFDVRCYNGCIVGGIRFHTIELDSRRTTQNSGIMVIGESDASGTGDNNFYGVLDEVLHHIKFFYVDDPKNGSNWKVVQVIQNKRIWDVPEVEDVENDHINILEVVVSHQVDDHIEDDTLCRNDVDPTIVERPVVRHVTDNFIDDVDEHLSHASDEEL
ncbi:hypothetical protein E5676_scaffold411G001130 [Cucumis melo var. makuwa]|uniref:DUF4218 domain-containing protein n=1 Tax=Cucumis melo var. makuwa TaxID=1194695 RepID=A0A5D3D342_CUCMM|nr:hypothetical protein E6C27_scaffold427G00020 [Cucumis melo var. makuwa]TYK18180.1 hypothetical protein E5676_scaffold411G001130 [Cucumis melo var. makuwa]